MLVALTIKVSRIQPGFKGSTGSWPLTVQYRVPGSIAVALLVYGCLAENSLKQKPKPGSGGRNQKWDHYVEWADDYQSKNPDKTDDEAFREHKKLFAAAFKSEKRPKPTRDTLRKARHYRQNKTTR